jgi:ligand-binding SRPBCC domain-containing protein
MTAPVPLGRAFSIFENPHNLAKITPPWLNFRVVTPEPVLMRKGAGIEYVIRWLGLPIRWKTLITDYDPPDGFVDEQARGPYRLWRHRHTLAETAEGTTVTDCVTYRLPFGVLGDMAHAIVVKRQLLEIFRFRQRAVAEMLGVPGVRFDEPVVRPSPKTIRSCR